MNCVLKFFLVCVALIPQISNAQSKSVLLSNDKIHWIGRVSENYTFGWGGSGLQFNTDATEIDIKIECKIGPAYINVVTNEDVLFIRIENGTYSRKVSVKNPQKINRISIIKSTEGHTGQMRIVSLAMNGELKPKTPLEKKILFIGDSITCGYGNLSASHKEHYKIDTEDIYYTYGYVAARKMGWEFNTVAWSGKGMLRNYGKGDDEKRYKDTLPKIFDRALPHNPKIKWDHKKSTPDMICINLGTNDNAGGNLSKEKYISTYKTFVKRLRTYYPDVPVVNLVGPLYNTKQYEYMAEWITEACEGIKDSHVIKLPKGKGPKDLGADWHPSKTHHIRMGEFLGPELLKLHK